MNKNTRLLSSPAVVFTSVIGIIGALTIILALSNIDVFGNNNNQSMNEMMSGMMNKQPQDVIVEVKSNPIIPIGKESEIKLLILDKQTQKPMTDAQVIIGIEKGAAMTTMDMISPMINAEEQSKDPGVYVVRFVPPSIGIYTIHTHVIPNGKSMSSMMDNHVDLGIVAVAEDNL